LVNQRALSAVTGCRWREWVEYPSRGFDKSVGHGFERAGRGPKGRGQDARSNPSLPARILMMRLRSIQSWNHYEELREAGFEKHD